MTFRHRVPWPWLFLLFLGTLLLAFGPSARGQQASPAPAQAVARIHELAADLSYAQIAEELNRAGWRTAFGRPFTSQHVGYICRRDGCGRKGPRALGDSDQGRLGE